MVLLCVNVLIPLGLPLAVFVRKSSIAFHCDYSALRALPTNYSFLLSYCPFYVPFLSYSTNYSSQLIIFLLNYFPSLIFMNLFCTYTRTGVYAYVFSCLYVVYMCMHIHVHGKARDQSQVFFPRDNPSCL